MRHTTGSISDYEGDECEAPKPMSILDQLQSNIDQIAEICRDAGNCSMAIADRIKGPAPEPDRDQESEKSQDCTLERLNISIKHLRSLAVRAHTEATRLNDL